MQSGKGLSIWRFGTDGVIIRQNLVFSRSTKLFGRSSLRRLNWAKTQLHDANHRCHSTRNHTRLFCFSSGQFQGFPFEFLCVFQALGLYFLSFKLVLSLVKTILSFLGFYFYVLSLGIIVIWPRISCSLFKGFFQFWQSQNYHNFQKSVETLRVYFPLFDIH